jgi:cob(I)alamin adenosyltransferase
VARLLHDGEVGNAAMLRYLNRASDLVFVLARFVEGGESDPAAKVRGGRG